jgi:hypothetical protein
MDSHINVLRLPERVILMAYCSECGAHFDENDTLCSSCGRDLGQENNQQPGTDPGARKISTNADSLNFSADGAGLEPFGLETENNESAFSQADSQLGKGIIKPQKIELATDGVHFKYDAPVHSFVKAEPAKEKPREYRATDLDTELKTAEEVLTTKGSFEESESMSPVNENLESTDETQIPVEHRVSQDEQIADDISVEEIDLAPESPTLTEPIIDTLTQSVLTEPVLPEPELPLSDEGDIVIWESVQTWFGIPLGRIYRLTKRSLLILGKYDDKLLDLSLTLITEVSVRQSWFGKLLGIGNLLISAPDFVSSKVVLKGISRPAQVMQLLQNQCRNIADPERLN